MSQVATNGVIAEYEERARTAIAGAVSGLGLIPRGPIDLRPLPFSGTWGVSSSISHALAGEAAANELASTGELEGLPKKEAKQRTSQRARELSVQLAEQIAASLESSGVFATVEAANGYVNISFDPMVVASGLVSEVLSRDRAYGAGAPKTERVMVEHSQPNTHKVFHVGHLRNSVLGVSVSRIMGAAGYPVMEATYPGDIGMHVIKCLWCYERFHLGQEPENVAARGAWIGQVYAESDARLEYRKDLIGFLQTLIKDDPTFVESIDRLLKLLWREDANNEDIAYLLGRVSFGLEIRDRAAADDARRAPRSLGRAQPHHRLVAACSAMAGRGAADLRPVGSTGARPGGALANHPRMESHRFPPHLRRARCTFRRLVLRERSGGARQGDRQGAGGDRPGRDQRRTYRGQDR
jgi:arginyl-tRNA synthetase